MSSSVKGFGCLARGSGVRAAGAGVRKPPGDEATGRIRLSVGAVRLPARGRLTGPVRIDGQRRIGGDLQRRAMVIAVVAVRVEGVLAHPLDDLQRAGLAIDVGQADIGLMERARSWTLGVDK